MKMVIFTSQGVSRRTPSVAEKVIGKLPLREVEL